MQTIEQRLSNEADRIFKGLFPDADWSQTTLSIFPTKEEKFGDYQCNAAMSLAKTLRLPPRAIAEKFVARAQGADWLDRAEVAGPGFINFFLKDQAVAELLQTMADDPALGVPQTGTGRTVILDYSSPNVAKPMHIGHIRSTVIGNAIDRLHRFCGYRVIADNHLGDWGTQFGLIIMGYKNFLNETALQDAPVEELERLYIESHNRSKADPAWREQAKAELVKLQQGDKENLKLWRSFIRLTIEEFNQTYDRLGVKFDLYRGESYYNMTLPGVIERLQQAGLAKESDGALVCDLEAEDLKICIVRKSDGGYNYTSTDIATVLDRDQEFNPDKIIYVTDERQQLHFRQFFTLCKKLGVQTELVHVWFGLMRMPDAVISTREGNVIKLKALLDEAEERALRLVQSGSPEMDPATQREVARAVGLGAVKYMDLSQNPQSLVTFTWDKALTMEGNSAPYLQYACARIASVRDKYREQFPETDPDTAPLRLEQPVERRLALHLLQFPAAVCSATELYRPNLLADYLYSLSQVYSSYYQNLPFLKAEEGVRESRIRLCGITARVLRQGLELLGIETPERI